METRDIIVNGEVIGTLSFPEGTPEYMWQDALSAYNPPQEEEEDQEE